MPKRKELDVETTSEISDGEKIQYMTQTDGWQIVFAKLSERILDLQNINNLNDSSPEQLIAEIKARKLAVDILWDWLKSDVTGRVEQYENNLRTLHDARVTDEGYVDRP